jgi:hypothetical protein
MAKKKPLAGGLPTYTPQNSVYDTIRDIESTVGYETDYNTPEMKSKLYNKAVNDMLVNTVGISPFNKEEREDDLVQYEFDNNAVELEENEEDVPELKAAKNLYNRLVTNKGALPEQEFVTRAFANSMTGGWARLLGLDSYDDGFELTSKGITYDGDLLKLKPTDAAIFSDSMRRFNAEDRDKSFGEKVGETVTALMWDMPLLAASGALSGAAMKGTQIGAALLRTEIGALSTSKDVAMRVVGQMAQQSINFNILGAPATIDAMQDSGIGGLASQVMHNVAMGSGVALMGAGASGVMGKTQAVSNILKRNPAMREELAGLASSFGFGASTTAIAGGDAEDMIATGLAFAATHFTNPKSYNRVLQGMKNARVNIKVANWDGSKKAKPEFTDEYFVEGVDGELFPIDVKRFREEGEIIKTSTQSIKPENNTEDKYMYFNDKQSYERLGFEDALRDERVKETSKGILQDWFANGLNKTKYKQSAMTYDRMADLVAVAKTKQGSERVKIKDENLEDMMIEFENDTKIPYFKIKDLVLNNLEAYRKNPEGVMAELARLVPAEKPTPLEPGGIKPVEGPKEKAVVTDPITKKLVAMFDRAVEVQEQTATQKKMDAQLLRMQKGLDNLLVKGIGKEELPEVKLTKAAQLKKKQKFEQGREVPETKDVRGYDAEATHELLSKQYGTEGAENIIKSISVEEGKFILSAGREGKEISETKLKEYASEPAKGKKSVSEPTGLKEEKPVREPKKKDDKQDESGREGEKAPKPTISKRRRKPVFTEAELTEEHYGRIEELVAVSDALEEAGTRLKKAEKEFGAESKEVSDINKEIDTITSERKILDEGLDAFLRDISPEERVEIRRKVDRDLSKADAILEQKEKLAEANPTEENVAAANFARKSKAISQRIKEQLKPQEPDPLSPTHEIDRAIEASDIRIKRRRIYEVEGEETVETDKLATAEQDIRWELLQPKQEMTTDQILEKLDNVNSLIDKINTDKATSVRRLDELSKNRTSRKDEIESETNLVEESDVRIANLEAARHGLQSLLDIAEGQESRIKIGQGLPIHKAIYPEATLPSGEKTTEITGQRIVGAKTRAEKAPKGAQWEVFADALGLTEYIGPVARMLDKLGVEMLRGTDTYEGSTPFYRGGMGVRNWRVADPQIFIPNRKISVADNAINFLHEATHALTLEGSLSKKKQFDAWYRDELGPELQTVRSVVRGAFERDRQAAINHGNPFNNTRLLHFMDYFLDPKKKYKSTDSFDHLLEMLTVGLTEPDVIAYLSNIKMPNEVKKRTNSNTVWDWMYNNYKSILNKAQEVLGIKSVDDNALDSMMRIVDDAVGRMDVEAKDILDPMKGMDLSKVEDVNYLQAEVDLMNYKLNRLDDTPANKPIAEFYAKRKVEAVSRMNELNSRLEGGVESEVPLEYNEPDLGTSEPGGGSFESLNQSYTKTELGGTFRNSKESLDNLYGKDANELSKNSVREGTTKRDESTFKNSKPLSERQELSNSKQLVLEMDRINNTESGTKVDVGKVGKSKISRTTGNFKNYLKYNLPPVHFKDWSESFKKIYEHGEAVKAITAKNINRILYDERYWMNQAKWNKLTDAQQNGFLQKIKEYEAAIFEGEMDRLSWNDWAEWSGVNKDPKLQEVYHAYRETLAEATKVMVDGHSESLAAFGKDIGKEIPLAEVETELKSLKGLVHEEAIDLAETKVQQYKDSQRRKGANILKDNGKKAKASFDRKVAKRGEAIKEEVLRAELETQMNRDNEFKKQVASNIIGKRYKEWGENFYYNSSRPTNPDIFLIKAKKPGVIDPGIADLYGLNKNKGEIFTYAENAKEFETKKANLINEGYEIVADETYQIKDKIRDKSYKSKLTDQMLIELANKGDISIDNEIMEKLFNATKSGVNIHEIGKRYIPGMKYTSAEFNNQLTRFVRESVYSGSRPFHLRSMEESLKKWQNTMNQKMSSLTEAQKLNELGQWKYAQGYINQMKQAEKTWIDDARFLGITWQVGILKPSFLFQQATQVVQTGLGQMLASAEQIGISPGEAYKASGRAWSEMVHFAGSLHALRSGKTVDEAIDVKSFKSPAEKEAYKEKLKIMQMLEWSEKLAPTGVTEMTSLSPELDYGNKSAPKKYFNKFKDATAYLGKGVERLSRMNVASAFYDIGYKQGKRGEGLELFISENIDKAMGEWGKGGRAPLLYGRQPGSVDNQFVHGLRKGLMTYKTFSFYNYGQWAEMIKNKHYSALYAKVAVGTGLHGVAAFPLLSGMFALADMFTDDDTSMDYEMYKLADSIDEAAGFDVGKVLHKGLGSLAGADLSQMFGEDTPILSDVYARSFGSTWEEKVDNVMQGASVGFIRDMAENSVKLVDTVIDQVTRDIPATPEENEKAIRLMKKLSPIFARNVWNAMDYFKDGIEFRDGRLVAREDLTTLDIALKTASFPLSKVRRAYDEVKYDALANFNYYTRMEKAVIKHIQEIRRNPNLNDEQKSNEIQRFIQKKLEYRSKVNELKPEAMAIKKKRKK